MKFYIDTANVDEIRSATRNKEVLPYEILH